MLRTGQWFADAARANLAAVNNQLVRDNILLRSDLSRAEARAAALSVERDHMVGTMQANDLRGFVVREASGL